LNGKEEDMNFISGMLLTLWVAGWAIASMRAVRQARAAAIAGPISSK
jgi:hypothetical protein